MCETECEAILNTEIEDIHYARSAWWSRVESTIRRDRRPQGRDAFVLTTRAWDYTGWDPRLHEYEFRVDMLHFGTACV